MVTQLELKEQLNYDPDTGIFIWKVAKQNIKIGNIAGVFDKFNGYIRIGINGKYYLAHRLAWLYMYNTWPKNHIDHINGIRNDNRIENLRDVTRRENQQNQNKHRKGHLIGTHYKKTHNKWLACISVNKKLIHLGYYNTQLEAHEAYLNKLKENYK